MMMRWPVVSRCNAWSSRAHHRARAGVSLLEVVFAIGIVMIGLVGIAALLPVGGSLARKGAVADASAKAGANAVREFRTRGMSNPRNWRWFNSSAEQFGPVPMAQGSLPSPGTSFCLDPLFISAPAAPDRNLTLGSEKYKEEMTIRSRFPLNKVYDSSLLAMPRITLRSPANGVLNQLVAEEVFASADDLVFDRPSDRTVGPVQNFAYQNGEPNTPLKRYADCDISWMATLVPQLDRMGNADSATGVNPTNEYTLSVVVFDRRPIDRDLYDSDTGDPVPESMVSERVVRVERFYSGNPAFSGGDMTLVARDEREPEDAKDDLELRGGDWVMLSRLKPVRPEGSNTTIRVHKWYCVINAGEDPVFDQEYDQWTRDVTLVGADWDWDESKNYPTQATIVRGVVEVLEKTVRLENTSMWTR